MEIYLKSKCRQVAKDCGFVLSQWYLIWKEIYCPFFFQSFFLRANQKKRKGKKKFFNTDTFSFSLTHSHW